MDGMQYTGSPRHSHLMAVAGTPFQGGGVARALSPDALRGRRGPQDRLRDMASPDLRVGSPMGSRVMSPAGSRALSPSASVYAPPQSYGFRPVQAAGAPTQGAFTPDASRFRDAAPQLVQRFSGAYQNGSGLETFPLGKPGAAAAAATISPTEYYASPSRRGTVSPPQGVSPQAPGSLSPGRDARGRALSPRSAARARALSRATSLQQQMELSDSGGCMRGWSKLWRSSGSHRSLGHPRQRRWRLQPWAALQQRLAAQGSQRRSVTAQQRRNMSSLGSRWRGSHRARWQKSWPNLTPR